MRLFVALDLSPAVKASLVGVQESLPSSFRLVPTEQLHLTVQFLGETLAVERVERALATVSFKPLRLVTTGFGLFPHVLWLGIKLTKELAQFQQGVERALRPFARPDSHPFKPHVTLARFRRIGDEERALVRALEPLRASWRVDEFVLYRSILKPGGAEYEVVARFGKK